MTTGSSNLLVLTARLVAVAVFAAIAVLASASANADGGSQARTGGQVVESRDTAVLAQAPPVPRRAPSMLPGAVRKEVTNARVHPAVLQGTAAFEIGQLILMLLPDEGTEAGWDHRVASGINWITGGYEARKAGDGSDVTVREGMLRTHIAGHLSHVLLKGRAELGWTVRYASSSSPKFGPETIDIKPGIPGEPCFGSTYDGCDFDAPLFSVRSAGVQVNALCSRSFGSDKVAAFLLEHPGRKPTVMFWRVSGGSGGSSSDLTLDLRAAPSATLCEAALLSGLQPAPDLRPKASPAASQKPDVQFNHSLANEAAAFDAVYWKTAICMHDAAVAMLRLGLRDKDRIVESQMGMCSGPLINFLTELSGKPQPKQVAQAFAAALATEQLATAGARGR